MTINVVYIMVAIAITVFLSGFLTSILYMVLMAAGVMYILNVPRQTVVNKIHDFLVPVEQQISSLFSRDDVKKAMREFSASTTSSSIPTFTGMSSPPPVGDTVSKTETFSYGTQRSPWSSTVERMSCRQCKPQEGEPERLYPDMVGTYPAYDDEDEEEGYAYGWK
jgi:hypothetical protein